MNHAPFPPSSISRIIQCPGSWGMCERFPATADCTEAAEGEAAHHIAMLAAAGQPLPGLGALTPNGIPVTEEMLEGAELYGDTVRSHEPGASMALEQRLPPSVEIDPDFWGTPDAVARLPHVIEINDYKFGHRFVEVFENWQLLGYACLVVDALLDLDGHAEQYVTIRFRIIQPRSYHPEGPVRTWTITAADLRPYRNLIKAAITAARSIATAVCRVGGECRDCTARAHCGTLQRSALSAIDESTRPTPMELPPAALGLELRIINQAIEMLRARKSGLDEVALNSIRGGVLVPGFRTETGMGRERWKIPVAEVAALGEMMGITLTSPKPVTPKQAVKAGLLADVVSQFSETPHGETKLVSDDGSLTRRIFGG